MLGIRELGLWDGSPALMIDGGSGPPVRPAVYLEAAAGGYLRLVGPDGPVLWGLVDSGWYYVELVRSKTAAIHALPPIRVDEAEDAPGENGSNELVGWWTREYAARLVTSSSTPLALGRRYLFAPMESVASTPANDGQRWEQLVLKGDRLDALRAQGDEFETSWDAGYLGLVLTRALSDESDGRVKMWRKRARDRKLPPIVVWWCRGLYAHVVLDGHDRLHAALLEDVQPDVLVLADVAAHGSSMSNDADAMRSSMQHCSSACRRLIGRRS